MPIPFSVIGGFLGAGKTSFINALLADPQGVRYGVLVNDFGSLAIDASLLAGVDREVLSLANGCACCSVGSDLVSAIGKLHALGMDHIVLECSGVALPARIADLAKVAKGLRPHAIITLINAQTLSELLVDKWMADTYVKQLRSGGQLLVNRSVSTEDVAVVSETLLEAGIKQPIALQASLNPAQWLAQPIGSSPFVPVHELHQISTISLLASDLKQAKAWAQQAVELDGIYRLKGFVSDKDKVWLVQVVGKEVQFTSVAPTMPESAMGLVVIGVKEAVEKMDGV